MIFIDHNYNFEEYPMEENWFCVFIFVVLVAFCYCNFTGYNETLINACECIQITSKE